MCFSNNEVSTPCSKCSGKGNTPSNITPVHSGETDDQKSTSVLAPNDNINSGDQKVVAQEFEPIIPIRRPASEEGDVTRGIFDQMKSENNRLQTFITGNWPVSFISPSDLAKAGFYYVFESDRVRCTFCNVVVMEWEPTDSPMTEHLKHSPRCPFILGYDVGNVPIGEDPVRSCKITGGTDTCGIHCRQRRPIDLPNIHNTHSIPLYFSMKELGINPHRGPKNTDYVLVESRLRSFNEKFPKDSPVKPGQLAEAGFFYLGVSDHVKCFYCDGGLYAWTDGDDPWKEHARCFPECGFVLLEKGKDFINAQRPEDDPMKVEKLEVKDLKAETETTKTAVGEDLVKDNTVENAKETERNQEAIPESDDSAISSVSSSPVNSSLPTQFGTKESESNPLICKVCLDNDVGVVFLPCGHLVVCIQCASGLSNCPICRKEILGNARTYFT